jgi:hypothetical protein
LAGALQLANLATVLTRSASTPRGWLRICATRKRRQGFTPTTTASKTLSISSDAVATPSQMISLLR